MTLKYRALRQDLIRQFDLHRLFPRESAFQDWVKGRYGRAFKNGVYSQLRKGTAVPRRLVDAFAEYCCRRMFNDGDSPQKAALRVYCATRNIDTRVLVSAPKVAELISAAADASHSDPLMSATDFVRTLCDRGPDVLNCVQPCQSEASVRDAVEWVYVSHGRQINRPTRLSYAKAKKHGEQAIGLHLDEYQARAVAWWRYEPWTITMACDLGEAVGVSISLPLSDNSYGRVKDGHINTWDIRASDLRSPSQYLVVEAVAMTPQRGPATDRRPSSALAAAMVAQAAYLTSVERLGEDSPLQLLTCGFSFVTLERTATFHFAPTGTLLHETDMPVLERVIHIKGRGATDAAIWGNWRTLQFNLGGSRSVRSHVDTHHERS